jgi:chemotaxis protein histidine kinase CheA
MGDRLSALDGTLEIRSRPGEGTTLIGRLPLNAATNRELDEEVQTTTLSGED